MFKQLIEEILDLSTEDFEALIVEKEKSADVMLNIIETDNKEAFIEWIENSSELLVKIVVCLSGEAQDQRVIFANFLEFLKVWHQSYGGFKLKETQDSFGVSNGLDRLNMVTLQAYRYSESELATTEDLVHVKKAIILPVLASYFLYVLINEMPEKYGLYMLDVLERIQISNLLPDDILATDIGDGMFHFERINKD